MAWLLISLSVSADHVQVVRGALFLRPHMLVPSTKLSIKVVLDRIESSILAKLLVRVILNQRVVIWSRLLLRWSQILQIIPGLIVLVLRVIFEHLNGSFAEIDRILLHYIADSPESHHISRVHHHSLSCILIKIVKVKLINQRRKAERIADDVNLPPF